MLILVQKTSECATSEVFLISVSNDEMFKEKRKEKKEDKKTREKLRSNKMLR